LLENEQSHLFFLISDSSDFQEDYNFSRFILVWTGTIFFFFFTHFCFHFLRGLFLFS